MLHPCRYTRLEMVGLLIPAVSGYTIEQRKPETRHAAGNQPQPRPADGVRARSCVSRAPDAVCVVGEPLGSEYGHGMPCPMTQHRRNGTMPVPRDTTQQLLRKRLPVTRHAASDRMPHPLPRPPPGGGTRGRFKCLPPTRALRSVGLSNRRNAADARK